MATNISNSRLIAAILTLILGLCAASAHAYLKVPVQVSSQQEPEAETVQELPVESPVVDSDESGTLPPNDKEDVDEILQDLEQRHNKKISWQSSSKAIHGVVGTLGRRAHGQVRLTCGEMYNADSMSIITPKLPCGAQVAVTVKSTGKTVVASVAGRWAPFNPRTGVVAWVSEGVTQALSGTRDIPYDVAIRPLEPGQDPSTLPPLIAEALPAFSRYSLLSSGEIQIHARNIAGECGGCQQVAGIEGLGVFISVETRREKSMAKSPLFLGLTSREGIINQPWWFAWTMFKKDRVRVSLTMASPVGKRITNFVERASTGNFTADENAVAIMLKGATHYFACWSKPPKWAYQKRLVYRIGQHLFFTDEKPTRRYTTADFACSSRNLQVAGN